MVILLNRDVMKEGLNLMIKLLSILTICAVSLSSCTYSGNDNYKTSSEQCRDSWLQLNLKNSPMIASHRISSGTEQRAISPQTTAEIMSIWKSARKYGRDELRFVKTGEGFTMKIIPRGVYAYSGNRGKGMLFTKNSSYRERDCVTLRLEGNQASRLFPPNGNQYGMKQGVYELILSTKQADEIRRLCFPE